MNASAFQAGYDVHVTVTYNGIPSAPFPVFIDTPYTMTTSQPGTYCNAGGCNCQALGYPPAEQGYVNVVNHGIADLNGQTITPINTHETLENQTFLNGFSGNNPEEGTWVPNPPDPPQPNIGGWNSNDTFSDYLSACTSNPAGFPGSTAMFNETQKFWVGAPVGTRFQGACVELGIITLYTDHGTLSQYETPIVNQSDCAQGHTIN